MRPLRILVMNNYPLGRTWDEVRRGDKPDHHLYGLNHLQAMGHEIRIVDGDGARLLRRLGDTLRALRSPVQPGPPHRLWAAWRGLPEADVVYAPCGGEIDALAWLRACGWLHTPLVALQHHALNPGRLAALREPLVRALVRGVDAFPALSARAAAEINARVPAGEAPKSAPLAWGPDAVFYPVAEGPGHGALAAGRTGRDFATFALGAARAGVAATVIGAPGPWLHAGPFGPTVRLKLPPANAMLGYRELMPAHAAARVIAIPLHASPDALAGLTSLADALALGRPVVMTRNAFVDLDLEAEGIGHWVAPGDVDGWAAALAWFEQHPAQAQAMGRRARRLVTDGDWNSRRFAERVARLLEAAVAGRAPAEAAVVT